MTRPVQSSGSLFVLMMIQSGESHANQNIGNVPMGSHLKLSMGEMEFLAASYKPVSYWNYNFIISQNK